MDLTAIYRKRPFKNGKRGKGLTRPVLAFLLAGCLFATWQCTLSPGGGRQKAFPGPPGAGLTPAQAYAGEVLAYMMQVVLGAAGALDLRDRWRTRAANEPLDFPAIAGIMADAEKDKTRLLVQDANILGLSAVLYHYDEALNQFKGQYAMSLYPSAELIALRLLLAGKLARNERVDLAAVLDRSHLLLVPGADPAPADLSAMNFTLSEFSLLQAVIRSEPRFFAYMKNPFMVAAFQRIGLLAPSPAIEAIVSRAHYRAWGCRARDGAVNLLIVPSITREFDLSMAVSPRYLATVERLKQEIYHRIDRIIDGGPRAVAAAQKSRVRTRLAFHHPAERPFVVYPGNAEETIADLCPKADFSVVLLGKDVYRAVHIDPNKDVYPAANRIYLDLSDIRYGQAEEEIGQISRFVVSAIAGFP